MVVTKIHGFPKAHRLLKHRDFGLVYGNGTSYRNAGFHLFIKKFHENRPIRVGMTLTRRLGGAVVRNRLKRWTRETVRLCFEDLTPGFDIVFNYHQRLAALSRTDFDRLLKNVMQKANLLRKR